MTRTHRRTTALCALLLTAAACGGGSRGRNESGSTPTPAPSPSAPTAAPSICPLTGTPAAADVDVTRPALAVKIDNAPPARPQAGLDHADLVYEELAEGGITRFVAFFHCQNATRVGPVRSARLVDPDLLIQYKPILFAYSGANDTVLAKVKGTQGIRSVEHGSNGPAYQRVGGRPAPHNLFTSTAKLYGRAGDVKGPPPSPFTFEAAPAPAATGSPGASPAPARGPGSSVVFSFSGRPDHKYTYDAASQTYLRFQGLDQPFAIEGAGQARATNVVFLKVKRIPGALVDFQVVGSGEALVLSGGTSVKGTWNRAGLSALTKLTGASGAPIKLRPGNTWIHLVPESQPVTPS